jgi:hypothetical protein
MHQNIDLIELLRALNAEAAEYLIVGGYAFATSEKPTSLRTSRPPGGLKTLPTWHTLRNVTTSEQLIRNQQVQRFTKPLRHA